MIVPPPPKKKTHTHGGCCGSHGRCREGIGSRASALLHRPPSPDAVQCSASLLRLHEWSDGTCSPCLEAGCALTPPVAGAVPRSGTGGWDRPAARGGAWVPTSPASQACRASQMRHCSQGHAIRMATARTAALRRWSWCGARATARCARRGPAATGDPAAGPAPTPNEVSWRPLQRRRVRRLLAGRGRAAMVGVPSPVACGDWEACHSSQAGRCVAGGGSWPPRVALRCRNTRSRRAARFGRQTVHVAGRQAHA
jgi:hypothetical protein